MADFSTICSHFKSNNLPYFIFYPKSQDPIKDLIQHLLVSTPAEDISYGLVNFGFDVISIKQMSTSLRSPAEGTTTVNIPLFLITLPMMLKSHEIFKLTSPRYISIRVKHTKPRLVSHDVTTNNNSPTPGITASNVVWGQSHA
jgi:hypothetical protein